jgi:hypothetical protein
MIFQAINALLPESSMALYPVGNLVERGRCETAWPPLSTTPPRDQTRVLKHFEVFTDGRHAHRKWVGQLGHRCFATGQSNEDCPPCRIGECRKRPAEVVGHPYSVSEICGQTGICETSVHFSASLTANVQRTGSTSAFCLPSFQVMESWAQVLDLVGLRIGNA